MTVQPGSSLDILLELLNGAVAETLSTEISGTIGPVELGWVDTEDGPLPDPLQIQGAALEISDAESTPGSPFLFELIGVGASLSGPEVAGFLPDGNMNSFDLEGYVLNLNQGELVVTGTISSVIDLSVNPFALVIPEEGAVVAKVTETPTPDPLVYDVTMEINFDFMTTVPPTEDIPLPIDVSVVGTFVATGVKTVPEPSSGAALLSALFGVGLLRRR